MLSAFLGAQAVNTLFLYHFWEITLGCPINHRATSFVVVGAESGGAMSAEAENIDFFDYFFAKNIAFLKIFDDICISLPYSEDA